VFTEHLEHLEYPPLGTTYCMAKCVHANTALKIKNTDFLYLPGMDSANMKQFPCSKLDSHSVQLIKHANEMPFFAQTFK